MAEMVLPGTYIEVRPEGLIVPGRVSVGTIGIVGTAKKGPIGTPTAIGGYLEAREVYGDYDKWVNGSSDELTLVRALEVAFAHGASSVLAVRIAAAGAAKASYVVLSPAAEEVVRLTARTEGTWGNELQIRVFPADEPAFIDGEDHSGGAAISLAHPVVVKSARNRIRVQVEATGVTTSLGIIYDDVAAAPSPSQVKVTRSDGSLNFGTPVGADDRVTASYVVAPDGASTVSVRSGRTEERYTVVDGNHLLRSLATSALVSGDPAAHPDKAIAQTTDAASFGTGANAPGSNGEGADNTVYKGGLDLLLNEAAHIILGAGRSEDFADELNGHCQLASTDVLRRDRIGVVGSGPAATSDTLRGHNFDSDRLVFVAPGIVFGDAASGKDVTLPGAYTAAAVAGLLSSFPPHVSLTNKVLSVGDLQTKFTPTVLSQLVQARVLAVEARQGFRIVKGITTSSNTAWHQITTRRIVDYAKAGVRSAATPYIGLLNNERVRTALRTTVASFLNEMIGDEMLVSFELDVTATRDEERKGIVQVTMILRPTFSIDFIKCTMFLE
jgi:tail sheath protein